MENPGYYLWKDDEKVREIECGNADAGKSTSLPVKQSEPSLPENTGEATFAQNLKVIKKHAQISDNLTITLLALGICTLGILFTVFSGRAETLLFFLIIPFFLTNIAAVYFYYQSGAYSLTIKELESMRLQSKSLSSASPDDAELIDRYIAKYKRLKLIQKVSK